MSISTSIRCGPRARSTPSASTSTGRSPIGATGRDHLDYAAGTRSIYDLDYLTRQPARRRGLRLVLRLGATTATAQVRTPITDGAGKPWVFRYKDIKSWWLNAHYDRPGGVESGDADRLGAAVETVLADGDRLPGGGQGRQSAERVRRSEELGDGAAVLLARQPRRLHAAALPARVRRGVRSGRRTTTSPGSNPLSEVYDGRMIDVERIHVYSWDARPYPAFPYNTDVWGDGDNWRLGHWLTGRYRQRAAGRDGRAAAHRLRLCRARHGRAQRHGAGLRDRSRDGGARCAAAAGARLLLRPAGERRRRSSSAIAASSRKSPSWNRPISSRRAPTARCCR